MGCPGGKLRSGGKGRGLGVGKGAGPVGRMNAGIPDDMFDRIVDPKVGKIVSGKKKLGDKYY